MPRLHPFLALVLLTACGEDKSPSSESGTTDVDPASTGADTGSPTTSGDPPQDDEGFCENFLPPIVPEEAPPGKVGVAYELGFTLEGDDDAAGLDWAIESEKLPPGLTFAAETAILSGTPTTAGYYVFWVEASVPNNDSECPTAPENRFVPLTIDP